MDSSQLWNGIPPVLSTEEVAELLRLNPRTVLAMAKDGRLPAHRLSGCRKVQYLTAEVLAAVADAPAIDDTIAPASSGRPSASTMPSDVDPCDIWGAAPAWLPGEDWRQRCCSHWLGLANQAGLTTTMVVSMNDDSEKAAGNERSAGRVEIDGLLYEILIGPRQRTSYVDDEGETRWGLIDAVWVEPVGPIDAGTTAVVVPQ